MLREEQEMIEKQQTMIEAESKQRLQEQREKTHDSILRAKRDLQKKTALVVGLPPQTSEQEDKLKASEALGKSSDGKNKGISETKEPALERLTSYPSSESLQDFDLEEIDMQHYWYYAIKAERIKKKMEQATKAFNERDKCSQNLAQYDQYYAEYEQHDKKLNQT